MPAKDGTQWVDGDIWIPASAGMTILALPNKNRQIRVISIELGG